MPISPTYPGVYIDELPSGVHTIVGVSTSNTAFIGTAPRGPDNTPTTILGVADYERVFGGLSKTSMMGFAVRDFFQNGGSQAFVVRVVSQGTPAIVGPPAVPAVAGASAATIELPVTPPAPPPPPAGGPPPPPPPPAPGPIVLNASWKGALNGKLEATVDYDGFADANSPFYNLTVAFTPTGALVPAVQEKFSGISTDSGSPRGLSQSLSRSNLVSLAPGGTPAIRPDKGTVQAAGGSDGPAISDTDITTGIDSLSQIQTDVINLMCIPPVIPGQGLSVGVLAHAADACSKRRAMLIVDPFSNGAATPWRSVGDAVTGMTTPVLSGDPASYASVFFPMLKQPDPTDDNRIKLFSPCGAVAGIFARTDAKRGVWKAPAGIDAALVGVPDLDVILTDPENGLLNPLGLNCLRSFRVIGRVVWGSRTLQGADALASQWKYIPVRRTALYIEQSLYRGLQWAVFEPNDEPLWAQIRLNVGAFMQGLFRQGAFQGSTPKDAYFVKCDKESTTQNDINLGIVNIVVGFAPLKPAEFVVVKIQQMAGQVQT